MADEITIKDPKECEHCFIPLKSYSWKEADNDPMYKDSYVTNTQVEEMICQYCLHEFDLI